MVHLQALSAVAVVLGLTAVGQGLPVGRAQATPDPAPVFRAGVDLVSVSAVVRDGRGRIVRSLSARDFELIDQDIVRPIVAFRTEDAPVTVALLVDISGSMEVGGRLARAREAAAHVLAWLDPARDQVGVFAFDTALRELRPIAPFGPDIAGALAGLTPFGATSLHDAIARTAEHLAARATGRRAVVVLTDGLDNHSRLTPGDVSGMASAIDVPVYLLAVVSPIDHSGRDAAVPGDDVTAAEGPLARLAEWTGGRLFVTSGPADDSVSARALVAELRHQYLMAFEPAGAPGWHRLTVRMRDRALVVRARTGYFAGPSRAGLVDQEE